MRIVCGLAVLMVIALRCSTASALIPTAVGGRPGETDVNARLTLERGLIEPNENKNSWQNAQWNMYSLNAGHSFGTVGPLDDFFVRLDYTYLYAPAEVSPEPLSPGRACLGQSLEDGRCQLYARDRASFVTPAIGWNFYHPGNFAFGVFFQGTIPLEYNRHKFAGPRVDYFGGGTSVGLRITPWLNYESRLYFGTGVVSSPRLQNATFASTNLFGVEATRWLLPWKIGIKLGPYVDGDLTERFDARYDAAYTFGFDEGNRDRVRMFRFAAAFFPYVQVTDHAVLELGYVQKIFGYDTPATQFYTVGVRAAF